MKLKNRTLENIARKRKISYIYYGSLPCRARLIPVPEGIRIKVRATSVEDKEAGIELLALFPYETLWDMLKYELATKRSPNPGIQRRRREALAAINCTEELTNG